MQWYYLLYVSIVAHRANNHKSINKEKACYQNVTGLFRSRNFMSTILHPLKEITEHTSCHVLLLSIAAEKGLK